MGTPFMGEIKIFGFNFAPRGWAFCNGQLLPINQNQALFSLLGVRYGGNGQTNFALPDLRGRAALHFGAGFNQGERGGEEVHTLIASEMPAHNHFVTASSATPPTVGPPTGAFWCNSGNNDFNSAVFDSTMRPDCITNYGGSQAHENRSPYTVLNFCICLSGLFPSQN